MKRVLKQYVIATLSLFFLGLFIGTSVSASATPSEAVSYYRDFLHPGFQDGGQFALVYLNDNNIPDFIFDVNEPEMTFVFVDGELVCLDGRKPDPIGYSKYHRTYSYYPKKSLLKFRDYNTSDYEDKYYRITRVGSKTDIWQILHKDSKGIIFQGCTQSSKQSSGKTYATYWDGLLKKWIVRYKVSSTKFNSVLMKLTGGVGLKTCTMQNNTAANRAKYLNPNDYIPATIKLNKTSASLKVGDLFTLYATVTGKSKTVTWTSSNTNIASVSNGKVTLKKPGTVTITAKANGKTAACKITVSAKAPDLSYYKNKKLGTVMDAFPKGYDQHGNGITFWFYNGLEFHGNGKNVPVRDVVITYISLLGSNDSSLAGMKIGITEAKALQTLYGNGWKLREASSKSGGTYMTFYPKNGWVVGIWLRDGYLSIIDYYKYVGN